MEETFRGVILRRYAVLRSIDYRITCAKVMLVGGLCAVAMATSPAVCRDSLVDGFKNPPAAAMPRVWWHWMNGNVTEEGLRADLEWMKRTGIGGVQNFVAAFERGGSYDTPKVVEKPVGYLTLEWRRLFRDSVALADQFGLEYAIASAPGWSITGGPWVHPSHAMKKLVWSETLIPGGAKSKVCLRPPPKATGYFQDVPVLEAYGERAGETANLPTYYADVATVAYRTPSPEAPTSKLTITSSAGDMDGARLSDGDLVHAVTLPYGDGPKAWIKFRFQKPERIQAVTFVIQRPLGGNPLAEPGPKGWLEVGDDTEDHFRKVVELPKSRRLYENSAVEQTVSFPPVTSGVFRLVLERPVPEPRDEFDAVAPQTAHQIAELVLHATPRVNRFEDKAGFSFRQILATDDTPEVTPPDAVPMQDVLDLTNRVDANGCLSWSAPKGWWVVLRFGYSLTGSLNRPAARADTGLEVDKLNRAYVKAYMDTYLGEYERTLGQELMGARGLRYMVTDSYEAGPQNWTDNLLDEFKARRHYDLVRWLPALAGRVIESAAASDRVLWDFRKTLGELMAEAHYGQISASLHERGMRRYGEAHEYNRFLMGDGMEAKKSADIPMGAMWASLPDWAIPNYETDLRESASVAHIYGQNLVAAESFDTDEKPYGFAPQDLKPIADRMLTCGINLFVIHTSVHQPTHTVGPGLGLGPVGQWFTRNETWADQASGWIRYLARSSYLLQQGQSVVDIAYFYGEDTNLTSLFYSFEPPIPPGFNFDFINPDALNEFVVRDHYLVTRAGAKYRLLVLDPSTQRMSLPVLRKLSDLVKAGTIVVGPPPVQTPSLSDDEQEFRKQVTELWSNSQSGHAVGLGRVFSGLSVKQVLQAMELAPDVEVIKPVGAPLRFVHRTLSDAEIYFIDSSNAEPQEFLISLRTYGRKPELWRANEGTLSPVSYRMERGRTIVSLALGRTDAVFIVLREPTNIIGGSVKEPVMNASKTLSGPWNVTFPPNLGAPSKAIFQSLNSWTQNPDPGIRYFSGTATYTRKIRVLRDWLKSQSRVVLDLGVVKDIAEIRVNGHSCAPALWSPPFRADVTRCVKAGMSTLEIRVTNLWPNRLIGDRQSGAKQIAFAAYDPFKADSPLRPSGLLGPVTILRMY